MTTSFCLWLGVSRRLYLFNTCVAVFALAALPVFDFDVPPAVCFLILLPTIQVAFSIHERKMDLEAREFASYSFSRSVALALVNVGIFLAGFMIGSLIRSCL